MKVDRILGVGTLSMRELALWSIVREAGYDSRQRRATYQLLHETLTAEEIYLANTVVALFQFYNTWVDLHGVKELAPEGYEASGVRLATYGYK